MTTPLPTHLRARTRLRKMPLEPGDLKSLDRDHLAVLSYLLWCSASNRTVLGTALAQIPSRTGTPIGAREAASIVKDLSDTGVIVLNPVNGPMLGAATDHVVYVCGWIPPKFKAPVTPMTSKERVTRSKRRNQEAVARIGRLTIPPELPEPIHAELKEVQEGLMKVCVKGATDLELIAALHERRANALEQWLDIPELATNILKREAESSRQAAEASRAQRDNQLLREKNREVSASK